MFSSEKRVLVIGDVMLDRYFAGSASRISPEAPVPILKVNSQFERAGGAANVALNIAALGVPTSLLAYVGDDREADSLEALLDRAGVNCRLIRTEKVRTIVKLRALAMQQQLLRLDFEDDFAPLDHQRLHDQFSELLPSHDVIVLSDYAKGTLADAAGLITSAKARSLPVLVDPKGLDFGKYAGATLLTPNMQEFSAVASAFSSEEALVEAAISLRAELDLEHLLVTRGEKGMSLFSLKSGPVTIPAHAKEVYDVTGAGDTVIATLAAAIASSVPIVQAMNLANLAASIVVARKGTASVTAKELRALWSQDDDEGAVLAQIEAAKAARESIVMTNGCFDILHAGHVDYLSRARALGDRLVVAVNSDASVERLKGETRPINRLEDRMAVLRALRVVDWVVSFDGSYSSQGEHNDTPLDIITAIKPHILAKGGDYSVETIVGAQDVMEAGGRVEVLPFIDGLSTTNILSRI